MGEAAGGRLGSCAGQGRDDASVLGLLPDDRLHPRCMMRSNGYVVARDRERSLEDR